VTVALAPRNLVGDLTPGHGPSTKVILDPVPT
jgi:hypothetical protein